MLEFSYIAGMNAIWYSCSGMVTYKVIHLSYDPEIQLLGNYPKEMKIYMLKNLYAHKNLCANVHNSFSHNSPKLEAT